MKKSIVISGSVRFCKDMELWIKELEDNGYKVYYPKDMKRFLPQMDKEVKEKFVAGVTLGYFEYIKKADVMLLFNPSGYAGVSTTLEMGYAIALSKPIFALEEDPELARKVLIEDIVKTPKDFLSLIGNK